MVINYGVTPSAKHLDTILDSLLQIIWCKKEQIKSTIRLQHFYSLSYLVCNINVLQSYTLKYTTAKFAQRNQTFKVSRETKAGDTILSLISIYHSLGETRLDQQA